MIVLDWPSNALEDQRRRNGAGAGDVVPSPEEVDLVGDLDLIAERLEPGPVRAVADDEEVDAAADHLQQVGGPNGVLDPLLRPEPAHQTDEPRVVRQPQLGQKLLPADQRGRDRRDAVGNHLELVRRQTVGRVEIPHARAVDHDPRGRSGQAAIEPEVEPGLPRIDAPLAGHQAFHAARLARHAAVGIGREKPGVDEIGPQRGDEPLQPAIGPGVELAPLADHGDRHAGGLQVGNERPAAGQGEDMNVELLTRQPAGQQGQLFLCPGAVERGDDLENAARGMGMMNDE